MPKIGGLGHVGIHTDDIMKQRDFYHKLQAENVKIDRIVSHGNALGMYFFDPEGNRVELYYKTGFDVPQPHGEPIDLDASNEELLAQARAAIPA